GKRPGRNSAGRLSAKLSHTGLSHAVRGRATRRSGVARPRHRPARWRCIRVFHGRAGLSPEPPAEEVVVGIGPIAVVIAVRPERVVKDVGISVRPEDRSEPGYEVCAVMAPPSVARRKLVPAVAGPAVTRVDPLGLLGKAWGETALPRCFFRHPRGAVQPLFTPRLRL